MNRLVVLSPLYLSVLTLCVLCLVSTVSTASGYTDQEDSATSDYGSAYNEPLFTTDAPSIPTIANSPSTTNRGSAVEITTVQLSGGTVAETTRPSPAAEQTTTEALTVTDSSPATTLATRSTRPPPATEQITTEPSTATDSSPATTLATRPPPATEQITTEPSTATNSSPATTLATRPTRPPPATEQITTEPSTATDSSPATTLATIPNRPPLETEQTTVQEISTQSETTTAAPESVTTTLSGRPTGGSVAPLESTVPSVQAGTTSIITDTPAPTRATSPAISTTTDDEIASIQDDNSPTTSAPTVFPIDPECRVPAYSSINYETTYPSMVAEDGLVVTEGKCYLECILDASTNRAIGVSEGFL